MTTGYIVERSDGVVMQVLHMYDLQSNETTDPAEAVAIVLQLGDLCISAEVPDPSIFHRLQ